MSDNDNIFLKDVSKTWQQKSENSNDIFIFSPYITSETAEMVLKNVNSKVCEIYTLFNAELFISRSSSIKTLINLKKKGVQLYALTGLHAKMFIVPGSFASIGSQNLTYKGTRNLEATVFLDKESEVREVYKIAKVWAENRIEISESMLNDMKELIEPYLEKYDEFLEELNSIDLEIHDREDNRKITIESKKQSLLDLSKSISKSNKAQEIVTGIVDHIEPSWDSDSNGTYSFLPLSDGNLIEWIYNGSTITMQPLYRYLCIIEDTGKFGWARVAKTRITYFSNGLSRTSGVMIGSQYCYIEYEALWDESHESGDNIAITIKPFRISKQIICKGWFGLDSLTINSIVESEEIANNPILSELFLFINDNKKDVSDAILDGMIEPFKYQSNLDGYQANHFFDNSCSTYKMRVSIVNGNPILVASCSRKLPGYS